MSYLKLFVIMLIISTSSISTFTYAGSTVPGEISKLEYLATGVILITTTANREQAEVPSCVVAGREKRWALEGTTDGSKVQVSGILAAYHAGQKVRIIGTGACGAFADSEEISFFQVSKEF